jgi:hypothetical protein
MTSKSPGRGQHLLEGDVRDGVLDHDAVGQLAPWAAVDLHRAEFALRQIVRPVAEGAFRVLHDVALVHDRDGFPPLIDRILDRGADEPLRAGLGDGLMPMPTSSGESLPKRIFLNSFGKFVERKLQRLHREITARLEIDASVNVSVFSRKITISTASGASR